MFPLRGIKTNKIIKCTTVKAKKAKLPVSIKLIAARKPGPSIIDHQVIQADRYCAIFWSADAALFLAASILRLKILNPIITQPADNSTQTTCRVLPNDSSVATAIPFNTRYNGIVTIRNIPSNKAR